MMMKLALALLVSASILALVACDVQVKTSDGSDADVTVEIDDGDEPVVDEEVGGMTPLDGEEAETAGEAEASAAPVAKPEPAAKPEPPHVVFYTISDA